MIENSPGFLVKSRHSRPRQVPSRAGSGGNHVAFNYIKYWISRSMGNVHARGVPLSMTGGTRMYRLSTDGGFLTTPYGFIFEVMTNRDKSDFLRNR